VPETELTNQHVIVTTDTITSEQMKNAHLVKISVKHVPDQLIIVLFVLTDMQDHHLVNGFQSLNQLRLKISQLDLVN
jgi:hypothetical protein